MRPQIADSTSRFSERLLRFLERIEHRVARSVFDREAVFRLRYQAYLRNGLMTERADGQLYDAKYDDAERAWVTMTLVDGELAGTTRINVADGDYSGLPAVHVYPDVMTVRLIGRPVVVEFTRLAARLELSSAYPELAYMIMRPAYLAAEYFDADLAVASPRAEHMAFYRRVFNGVVWCEPRGYPGLTAKFACMGADFRANRQAIEARYPFYRSSAAEREALFGPLPSRRPSLSRWSEFGRSVTA
jgi:hypothetical protein